jgi:hypothetical protein
MRLIEYGEFHFTVTSSPIPIKWPALGLALQKNYLSLYCPASNADGAFTIAYANRLGKIGLGSRGNSLRQRKGPRSGRPRRDDSRPGAGPSTPAR